MTLVVDASVAIRSFQTAGGIALLRDPDLVGPPLLWSEFRSAVHEALWRRDITPRHATMLRRRLRESSLHERRHRRLDERAWEIADQLGWAKTYDAEYVALADLLECRLVTADARLRRGTDRLGFVVAPDEL